LQHSMGLKLFSNHCLTGPIGKGARSEQLSHEEGWVKKVRNTSCPVPILP
jgi:hypothetical protein